MTLPHTRPAQLTSPEHYLAIPLAHGQSFAQQDTEVILMVGTKRLSVTLLVERDGVGVRWGDTVTQLIIFSSNIIPSSFIQCYQQNCKLVEEYIFVVQLH